jgi:hypothetical protein
LRDFNLQTRLFEYPCSYLIYSKSFDSLQPELRAAVYRQLAAVLSSPISSQPGDQVSLADPSLGIAPEQRLAILEILRDTKADWPD